MRIGEVARRAGQSIESIRYSERIGLIPAPARAASGYRRFDPAVVRRLQSIQNAQTLTLKWAPGSTMHFGEDKSTGGPT